MAVVNRLNGIKTTPQFPAHSSSPSMPSPVVFEEHWLDLAGFRQVLMTFTPEMAGVILETRNTRNRLFRRASLLKYVKALKAGAWRVNGETLIFDSDGNLCNGQHRLLACYQAGIPLTSCVVFGVDPDCFTTMDQGAGRSISDVFGMLKHGYKKSLAAAVAMIWRDEKGGAYRFNMTPSVDEAIEVLGRHPDITEAVAYVNASNQLKFIPARLAAFCLYRFAQLDHDEAYRFFDDLKSGAIGDREDPVLQLRNQLMGTSSSSRKHDDTVILALTIKAWNYRRQGRRVRYIRWQSVSSSKDGRGAEDFPTII